MAVGVLGREAARHGLGRLRVAHPWLGRRKTRECQVGLPAHLVPASWWRCFAFGDEIVLQRVPPDIREASVRL
eukprot:8200476-Pyramimonas_sp.AAC.1